MGFERRRKRDGGEQAPEEKARAAPIAVAPGLDADVHGLLLGVRNQMDGVMAREIERIELSFAGLLAQTQSRLRAAEEQLGRLREEREGLVRANEAYVRRFEALRALENGA
ncbi:MAG TPA: hypothetical protein VHH36_05610 [Candidatus Thermoplasmatota archaeon]|nr:hypothetical protein [Candidatus Thermoplasmatota archaeon]